MPSEKLEFARLLHSLPSQIGEWEGVIPELERCRQCIQDPLHHAEGDVFVHTEMVLNELQKDAAYLALPFEERQVMYLAALLHDIGKPLTTREDNGRVIAPGHSRKGEIMARKRLWQLGLDFTTRERICLLIRHHQLPLSVAKSGDLKRKIIEVSLRVSLPNLTLLSKMDALGRVCRDINELLTSIEMFSEYAKDNNCWDKPYDFYNEISRFQYLHSDAENPYQAYDDKTSKVFILSGLPGSGKDTYIKTHLQHLPVISLDAIREENKLPHSGNQGRVIDLAHQKAKEYMRQKIDFVWNATVISRRLRDELISFLVQYPVKVEIVYLEVANEDLYVQNSKRREAVPQEAIERLLDKWEVPTLDEAHSITYHIKSPQITL